MDKLNRHVARATKAYTIPRIHLELQDFKFHVVYFMTISETHEFSELYEIHEI